jgi:hypothetical protein
MRHVNRSAGPTASSKINRTCFQNRCGHDGQRKRVAHHAHSDNNNRRQSLEIRPKSPTRLPEELDKEAALLPLVKAIQSTGAVTLEAITRALNERGVRPARGTRWYASSVANLLSRAQKLAAPRADAVGV